VACADKCKCVDCHNTHDKYQNGSFIGSDGARTPHVISAQISRAAIIEPCHPRDRSNSWVSHNSSHDNTSSSSNCIPVPGSGSSTVSSLPGMARLNIRSSEHSPINSPQEDIAGDHTTLTAMAPSSHTRRTRRYVNIPNDEDSSGSYNRVSDDDELISKHGDGLWHDMEASSENNLNGYPLRLDIDEIHNSGEDITTDSGDLSTLPSARRISPRHKSIYSTHNINSKLSPVRAARKRYSSPTKISSTES